VVAVARDRWAEWLLQRRYGGDRALQAEQLPRLYEFRDRVLGSAAIAAGDTVLDLGAGDGLIAFGALERVGPQGEVIFDDVSEDLLDESRRIAADLGVLDRCRFVLASADDLPLDDASVDVVTARSVLIYLMDKRPAVAEAFRVLRPGGRLSIFEPINIFCHPEYRRLYYGLDLPEVEHLVERIRATWPAPEEHPLLNFDERDLLGWVEEAGFDDVRMEYTAEIATTPHPAPSWDVLKRSSGNPLDPTPEEEMAAVLTEEEQAELEAHARAAMELRPPFHRRSATVYLRATKP
jgi:arsenite methyltransferase